MDKSVQKKMKIALVISWVAIVVFALALASQPLSTEFDVSMNYVRLDRAGAINNDVLSKFHPSYDFAHNPRFAVPLYIARPALKAQLINALLGMGFAVVNVIIIRGCLRAVRRSASVKAEGAADGQ
jgi:hypothetical protein